MPPSPSSLATAKAKPTSGLHGEAFSRTALRTALSPTLFCVLSRAVVAELRKGADPEKFKMAGQPMRAGYSYHDFWWIPHDRDGSFEAKGLNGQHVHVNPAAELVVVKLSSHPVPNTAFTHVQDRQAFSALAGAVRSARSAP